MLETGQKRNLKYLLDLNYYMYIITEIALSYFSLNDMIVEHAGPWNGFVAK